MEELHKMESSLPKKPDGDTLNRLSENERHFHTIQAGVRGIASTWVLAAFASIAVLLEQIGGCDLAV